MLSELVELVGKRGLAEDETAEGEDSGAGIDHGPLQAVLGGPAIPEEPCRQQDHAGHHPRRPELGPPLLIWRPVPQPLVYPVHYVAAELGGCRRADRDRDIVEAGVELGLVVSVNVQACVCRQQKGVDAKVESHQHGNHLDHRTPQEQTNRTGQGNGQPSGQARAGGAPWLPHPDFVGLAAQEDGRIRFADEHEPRESHGCVEDAHDPKDPRPGHQLGDETANDGAEGGAEIGEERGNG